METRKTAKYYRDILNGNDIRKAVSILPEVIKKFGSKRWATSKHNDQLYVKGYTEFEWNHQIESFNINDKGVAYISIYWQGDSTDGYESEFVSAMLNGKTIPAVHEWLGDRTYCKHSDLRISAEEFRNALKAVATYLSPEEIKTRKIINRRRDAIDKIFNYLDTKKKGLERWEMEGFWNGRIAVQKVIEMDNGLTDKPWEEIKPIVDKIFSNNNKSDYSLRGGWYNGEKKYNLAY